MSRLLGRTRKEAPADAELPSHRLLARAGYIQRVGSGIYALTPLGLRVLRRIEAIIRTELDAIGAQEVLLPLVQPAQAWQRTGRYDSVDESLLRFTDRSGHPHVLSMTHEEAATSLVAEYLDSYRKLPLLLYQIQLKFRDEPRPRGGLIRLREFVMQDAYSFDFDADGLGSVYEKVAEAYRRIFARVGVDAVEVVSDSGIMGGWDSREFTLRSPVGEDHLLACACGYAANEEAAPHAARAFDEIPGTLRKVATPRAHTIEALCDAMGCRPEETLKSIFCACGELTVLALVRGDREVCLTKLGVAVGSTVRPLSAEEMRDRGIVMGFAGPIGLHLPGPLRIVLDHELQGAHGLIAGANEEDAHLAGVSVSKDLHPDDVADIALARAGDPCPACGSPLHEERGIEVGNIFKLGTFYSAALGAAAAGPDGASRPLVMGSYGIGVTRLIAAITEAHHDDRGISWPREAAPYPVHLVAAGDGPDVRSAAEALYLALGGEVALYDDRPVSAGVKFQDADLLGMPLRATIGARSLAAGGVELRSRQGGETRIVGLADAKAALLEFAQG